MSEIKITAGKSIIFNKAQGNFYLATESDERTQLKLPGLSHLSWAAELFGYIPKEEHEKLRISGNDWINKYEKLKEENERLRRLLFINKI
jgi:hypothetical protein